MIIQSLLDNDLYKFTMQQAVLQKFPDARVKYSFINRGNHKFTKEQYYRIVEEIRLMDSLYGASIQQRTWLKKNCPYLSSAYLDYLSNYQFDHNEVSVMWDSSGTLSIAVEGLWVKTILWEVPIMAIISEVFNERSHADINDNTSILNKIHKLENNGINFSEFGTRRRFSTETQDLVTVLANTSNNYLGTSNVYLAYTFNVNPIGTQAHEWIMFHGSVYGYTQANELAMRNWVDVYQGHLGITLTDTYGVDNFLQSFGLMFAKLFDGVRHDSGCPFDFTDKIVNHYDNLGINPLTKIIIFSDGLDPDKAIEINEYCKGKIQCSFGIGTNLTNDVPGGTPMNIVIKLTRCSIDGSLSNLRPAVKLSDVPGKHTGDIDEINLCKKVLGIR